MLMPCLSGIKLQPIYRNHDGLDISVVQLYPFCFQCFDCQFYFLSENTPFILHHALQKLPSAFTAIIITKQSYEI